MTQKDVAALFGDSLDQEDFETTKSILLEDFKNSIIVVVLTKPFFL